jgi:type III restriction enzyme
MAVTIENPILNSPFDAPARHFTFDEQGITATVAESRRKSAYFMPIAQPRQRGAQRTFETEWTLDRIRETTEVNRIRERVDAWRTGDTCRSPPRAGPASSSPTTMRSCCGNAAMPRA